MMVLPLTEPFLPCTTGVNGAHEWNDSRDRCAICGYIPPRVPLSPNNGVRRASACKAQLIVRDGAFCRYCGTDTKLTIEHLIPRSRGGTGHKVNLGLACVTCNNVKGNLTEEEFIGWLHTGELPFSDQFVEIRRVMKCFTTKREPLLMKYLKLHE